MIDIGYQLPDFSIKTEAGIDFTLAYLKGSPTVLYFYPKDNTSGCTLEAKSLRDGKEELKRRGYKIVGVSPDSVKSHQGFCLKHELNFTLLAEASMLRMKSRSSAGQQITYSTTSLWMLKVTRYHRWQQRSSQP